LSAAQLTRIRQIELRTRKLVHESLAGSYHSAFKGRGIEFDAVRPYEPGDDVRLIDWNVTARSGDVFVKRHIEERELRVMLLVDASGSTAFGSAGQHKRQAAVEIGALVAYSAIRNHDRVSLVTFSDRLEGYVPPRKGRNHMLRLIQALSELPQVLRGTDLASALRTADRLSGRRSILFVMSDFLTASADYLAELRLIAKRHDVIAIVLSDPLEVKWPDAGLVRLRDAETGEYHVVDLSREAWRERFVAQSRRFRQMRDQALAEAGIDRIDIRTDHEYLPALVQFFEMRRWRLGR
ncbi:MAG: DUF58 domain-containing protein, partial [Anaerolineae bacterium]|nr:DUF58 domain-containing protein [Anaerolineae bacterium]